MAGDSRSNRDRDGEQSGQRTHGGPPYDPPSARADESRRARSVLQRLQRIGEIGHGREAVGRILGQGAG
jgi:hypothetical protein